MPQSCSNEDILLIIERNCKPEMKIRALLFGDKILRRCVEGMLWGEQALAAAMKMATKEKAWQRQGR